MDGNIEENAQLDCAIFQILSAQNRYEAVIFSKGMAEKLASGSLDHLALHLSAAKQFQLSSSNGTFKLQLAENLKGSSWFTKSTLLRFLNIISSPEMLESANQLLNEMSQLEETRKLNLALYVKDQQNHLGSGSTGGLVDNIGVGLQVNVDAMLLDATKNELLQALDLRLAALKEEMMVLLNQAARSKLSTEDISDLGAFVQHFGAIDFRSSLLRYLLVLSNYQPSKAPNKPTLVSQDTRSKYENALSTPQLEPQADIPKHLSNGVPPAKLAQVERQSSTESEESSVSSDESHVVVERSRPAIRAASPRRSASPMRRVQIGRSGSHRSMALSIKSLSYFPVRERIPEENCGFADESDQPLKKPESMARMMSVQDAINLFESKQKDQNLDIQTKRFAGIGSTNKSVLRRWSAGMGDSFKHQSTEDNSDATPHNNSINLAEAEKDLVDVKVDSDVSLQVDGHSAASLAIEIRKSSPASTGTEPVKLECEEIIDRATASAEWNRQKEAELNQMLLKMMESKPGEYADTSVGDAGAEDAPSEQKGGFYSDQKEKRDAKRRADSVGKRVAKEAHLKAVQSPEQSREKTALKSRGSMEKRISSIHPPKSWRNSAPPVLPKKEASKMPASKKAPPNVLSLPARRSSWSSGQPTTTNIAHKTKGAIGTTSSTPPNRRKVQAKPSTTQPIQQQKNKKEYIDDVKPAAKRQEEKKLKPVPKTRKSVKAKDSPALKDDSGLTAKPSLYSKVTKKSSVVPLESRTSMRKGTGAGSTGGSVTAKRNASRPTAPSKDIGSPIRAEDEESITKLLEADLAQPTNDVDANLEISPDNDLNTDKTENSGSCILDVSVELPAAGIQPDQDTGISSAAWVEVEEHEQAPTVCQNDQKTDVVSHEISPIPSSSPRIRHSLSHMLQADSNGTEIVEWGNAENPPAFIYQKDSPKGLKRLLKFARKTKAESNMNGWPSPSVFSEGEDDLEDSRGANVKGSDLMSRKTATLQAKAHRQHQNTVLSESFDGGNSSKRAFDSRKMHNVTSAQASTSSLSSLSSDKLRDGHASVTASSTKGARSFFSLSTFRSSKSNDSRPR